MKLVSYLGLLAIVLVLNAWVEGASKRRTNAVMVTVAQEFLASLDEGQRAKAQFALADAERLNWHFIPRERKGISFKEMTQAQRAKAHELLRQGLSAGGLAKTTSIIELENVLREMGGNPNVRDPELYFFSVFGKPSEREPWGWRFEGHHLSLNYTFANGDVVATAPAFMGANPAEVRSGSKQGLRALAPEEDLARALVVSLTQAQRSVAIISAEAPRDIVTMNNLDISPLTPAGIAIAQLDGSQREKLVRVIDEYLDRMQGAIARERRVRLQRSDINQITFAWAGSIERGAPHYYRIQGPTFLIEYDNTQNNANHVHSVWRDFNRDFGRDILREHYREIEH